MRHSDPRLTATVYQQLEYDELATALESVGDTSSQLAGVVKVW